MHVCARAVKLKAMHATACKKNAVSEYEKRRHTVPDAEIMLAKTVKIWQSNSK